MDIVHVDPGYGRLMRIVNNSGDEYGTLEYVENATYNPYSGVAFHLISGNKLRLPNLDFTFEPTAGQIYKKVWSVKFSVYMENNTHGLWAGFAENGNASSSTALGMSLGNASSHKPAFLHFVNGDHEIDTVSSDIPTGEDFYNVSITYSLTAEPSRTYSTSTITFNDEVDFQYSEEATFSPQYFIFDYAIAAFNKFHISNVLAGQASYEGDGTGSIPSDDGIPADTPIYRLPLGTPITDFTEGDNGEYIGTENGQTLLQTVNSSTLITTYGNRPINHIVAYGAPGYRVGSAVSSATGISKSNDSDIVSHGNHTLPVDKTMHVYDVWKVGDGNTFSDINGLQVGWRAGE